MRTQRRRRLFKLLFNLTVNKHESYIYFFIFFFHLYYIRNYCPRASSIHRYLTRYIIIDIKNSLDYSSYLWLRFIILSILSIMFMIAIIKSTIYNLFIQTCFFWERERVGNFRSPNSWKSSFFFLVGTYTLNKLAFPKHKSQWVVSTPAYLWLASSVYCVFEWEKIFLRLVSTKIKLKKLCQKKNKRVRWPVNM